ncbi:hypothetical protein E3N88_17230 [Mikania micrantha]|uniref:Uncharacterized protein n=1 Tax=Mikania micrantha TaxID=192012 RepID=A0A5N6NRT5_9ASTR|nr:hypothetical protein E3N88_17230 [Mikania micrantha]
MVLNEVGEAYLPSSAMFAREGVIVGAQPVAAGSFFGIFRFVLDAGEKLLVPAVTYRRTSVPEAKKEEQEQEVVLSRPSSSATTTVVVANGDPPFRKVTGPAVRPKVVCHSYGADRFTTSAPLSDISG